MPQIISYKRLAKLPRVVLEGSMPEKIRCWFDENHLSPLVPPIFSRFVIEYPIGVKCCIPESDVERFLAKGFRRADEKELENYAEMKIPREFDKLEPHEWVVQEDKAELLVDYDPSLTKATVTMYDYKKRRYSLVLDYDDLDAHTGIWRAGMDIDCESEDEAMEIYEESREHVREVLRTVIAVQSYILYHHSEQIAAPKAIKVEPKSEPTAKPRKKKKAESTIKIKHQIQPKIIIRESAPLPRRAYDYKTLAWNVRGHYARRGTDKHLTYIAPYICRRGDEKKKPRAAEYRITEGDKEE